jgi:hypothetical protein
MQEWQKMQEMIINKIAVERAEFIDNAIFGEIQEIAVENGIETKIVLNEKAVLNALEKQIPKKPKDYPLSDGQCPSCNAVFDYDWKAKSRFCQNCGQALDWSDEE